LPTLWDIPALAGLAAPCADDALSIGEAIEELVLLLPCSLENEWENRVVYLPA